jgi:allantoicase
MGIVIIEVREGKRWAHMCLAIPPKKGIAEFRGYLYH